MKDLLILARDKEAIKMLVEINEIEENIKNKCYDVYLQEQKKKEEEELLKKLKEIIERSE